MTLRLRNGRFASTAKVRAERNKYFHRALISACAAFKRAGFKGKTTDPTLNERVIHLKRPVYDYEYIIDVAGRVEARRLYPDVIYNVSFQDSTGRWFAITQAWETVELASRQIRERIKEMMERYQRTNPNTDDDDDEYAIVAVMVSVYNWRK